MEHIGAGKDLRLGESVIQLENESERKEFEIYFPLLQAKMFLIQQLHQPMIYVIAGFFSYSNYIASQVRRSNG